MDLNESGIIQTGNISTDEFLAIFTATSTTTDAVAVAATATTTSTTSIAINRNVNELKSNVDDYEFIKNPNHHSDIRSTAILKKSTPVTLNPPIVTIDGQYTVTSLLDNNLVSFDSTLSNNDLNDTFLLWSGNFYNSNSSISATYGSTAINLSTTYANFLNSTNNSNQNSNNQALNNLTGNITEVHWDGRYPSGYTLTHIVVASIIVTILMIIIIVGNMLVIIAIATEKSLKNIQNWFIASLAVADFFLGLIIMPFSLANELMGYWIFGSWWCDIHSAMDVLLCTASIMNLCLISLDRYWSITKAVDYLKSRTPARAALMIAAVWIMSALICIPPLLGWKVKLPEGPLPKCQLSEDIGYVLYSALGSFYIPSCIMVFVYIRIYFAAKARARRGIKKHTRKSNNEQVTSFTTSYNKKGTIPIPSSSSSNKQKQQQQKQQQDEREQQQLKQIATIEAPPPNNATSAITTVQIPTVTCDLASDVSTSDIGDMEPQPLLHPSGGLMSTPIKNQQQQQQHHQEQQQFLMVEQQLTAMANCKEAVKVSTITTSQGDLGLAPVAAVIAHSNNLNNNNGTSRLVAMKKATTTTTTLTTSAGVVTLATTGNELKVSPLARARALSVGIDTDMVSEFDPSSSDSGVVSRCAVVKPLKFRLCQPIFGRKTNNRRQHDIKKVPIPIIATNATKDLSTPNDEVIKAELEPAIPKVQKSRDPEKEKRRIARKKEKRATLILGLIMGSFIACWLPFFFLYILMPACSACSNRIPDSAFAIAFWLGYMNSALNPAIYTIFNKDFRRAFRRILFK